MVDGAALRVGVSVAWVAWAVRGEPGGAGWEPEAALFIFKQKTAYEIGLGIPAEPLFRSAGKGLLEGTLQAGTSAVSDKLLDLVGLGGKSAADKGKDTRDYLAAAFPELNAWERAGADASSAGMVDAG